MKNRLIILFAFLQLSGNIYSQTRENRLFILKATENLSVNNFEVALMNIDKAIRTSPKDSYSHQLKCFCLDAIGKYREAIESCNKAVELDISNYENYETRADVYLDNGFPRTAITDYGLAIMLEPHNAELYSSRGDAYEEVNSFQDALKDHNKSIELDPSNGDFYAARLLLVGSEFENPQLVIEDCNRIFKYGSNYLQKEGIYKFRGEAYLELGDYKKAIKDLDKAANPTSTIAPQFKGAANISKAKALFYLNQIEEAKYEVDKGLKIMPTHPDGLELLRKINMEIQNANAQEQKRLDKIKEQKRKEREQEELEQKRKEEKLRLEQEKRIRMEKERIKELEHQRKMDSIERSQPSIEVTKVNIEEQNITNNSVDKSTTIKVNPKQESETSFFDNLIKIIGFVGAILAIFVSIKALRKRSDEA